MTCPPGAVAAVATVRASHDELSRIWPDGEQVMPATSAGLAGVAGLAAAILLPTATAPGLGVLVVGLLVAAAAWSTVRSRIGRSETVFGVLATALLAVVVVYDADWFVSLCLLGCLGLASYALSGARTFLGVGLSSVALPLAALRGLPWIGRGIRALVPDNKQAANTAALLRATATTAVLLLVFGALFASADPAYAAFLPNIDLGLIPLRFVVFCFVAAVAVAAAFLGAAPPRFDVLAPGPARPVRGVEWMTPLVALNVLFGGFVAVQLAVLFGGHDHVLRTAGLTYAEYARRGFGQLVVVTLLVLGVVAAAARWAPRDTTRQRSLFRGLLGLLCGLAIVVVASALYRLHLYEEAFGFTRLRLFMNVFEGSLGVLLGLVVAAGIRLNGSWLPRAAVALAAAALLSLAAINPDGFVAQRNVERFAATGKLDVSYLQNLSEDALPAVDRLAEPMRSCVLQQFEVAPRDGFASWNLSRHRAREILDRRPVDLMSFCPEWPIAGGR